MPKKRELAGRIFGRLTVLSENGRDARGAVLWRCVCACGRGTVVRSSSLIQSRTRSCGCGIGIAVRTRLITHGGSKTALYLRWRAMKDRCERPRNAEYRNYGGRGIRVCGRWQTFENFRSDMGATFQEALEIDRRDNEGNYEPSNCLWVSHTTNSRNKRTNHYLTINGVSKTLIEWGEATGLKPNTILTRVRRGWPEVKLLLSIANKE